MALFTHNKTGALYEAYFSVTDQTNARVGTAMVVYGRAGAGPQWVREHAEFVLKFTPLPATRA